MICYNILGVRQCDTDQDAQKVIVGGDFNLDEVVETVKRKLGKKTEVLTTIKEANVIANEDDESEIVPEKINEDIEIVPKESEESEIVSERNEEIEIIPKKNEEIEIVP
ncbi:unnamed protein product [Eruca vesicaria subsp. sativa]|uniref:Uncharacterized protein n=1 Tax=Eruca vesicaria subsp. sativa TaxID=29727 RepID=A0ABC8J5Y7_ERUVS|nr:unnamed protein product [Eruca vesicaria subsp. sativa]